VTKLITLKNNFLSPEQKISAFQEKMKTKERINMNEWEGSTVISNPPAM
jgi:hypothetical protein